jgi:hypothetical protein
MPRMRLKARAALFSHFMHLKLFIVCGATMAVTSIQVLSSRWLPFLPLKRFKTREMQVCCERDAHEANKRQPASDSG